MKMLVPVRYASTRAIELRMTFLLVLCTFLFAIPASATATHAGGASPAYGCTSGSGSCFDTFGGTSGTDLATYNPNWILASGIGRARTTGTYSASVAPGLYTFYRYAPSKSETSQITVDPSNAPDDYSRVACVRISAGAGGYCVGFTGSYKGFYANCVIEKDGQYLGNGSCGPIASTTSHTLAITASGKAKTALAIYLDGVYTGSVQDTDAPYTVAGSGFGLEGGASDASAWRDYRDAASSVAVTPAFGCTSGSGTCSDTFAGSANEDLATYNPSWVNLSGTGTAFTTGSNSTTVGTGLYTFYMYAPSRSETSQITIAPSSSRDDYSRDACVRMSSSAGGYCVGFGGSYGGFYSNCVIEKGGQYVGNGNCGYVNSANAHTLAISASGTSTVTLAIYLDGVYTGSVTDSDEPYTVAGSGFGLEGGASNASSWQDYRGANTSALVSPPATVLSPTVPSSPLPAAVSPVFSPAGGTYSSAQTISLSSSTLLASIYYTTDGSTPTNASTLYQAPISVTTSTTIKAIAYALLNSPSAVSTSAYVIAIPTVQTPVFSVASPYTGSSTSVSIVDYTSGASIRYCQDTANTCTPSTLYTGPVSFTATGYIRAQGVLAGSTTSPIAIWQGTLSSAQITTTSCPAGTQYQKYAGCTIAASGGVAPYTYGWSTTTGSGLVEGLTLSPATGVISGTVYGQGVYSIPFTVTDSTNTTVTKTIQIAINADNTTGSCSLFPADSIWHLNVANLPVDTSVAAPVPSPYTNSALHLVFGSQLADGGIPFLRVPYNQQNVPVATTVYQSYFTSGPFPTYAPVESTLNSGADGDRHVAILQTAGGGNNCRLWEMWQGQPTASGWSDSSNAYWDLGTYDMLPQDNGSTDAAGLPILPLLWNYDEVAGGCAAGAECGVVKHAGRLTLGQTLNYHVWPATAQSGLGGCSGGYEDTNRLLSQSAPPTTCGSASGPMGEIYRLKAGTAAPAACTGHPQAQVLITAMRNYGLILADNGITGGLVATADARWNDDDLSCLVNLRLSDFEPVNVSSKMIDINSSQVRP